jgi:hypothetical protein
VPERQVVGNVAPFDLDPLFCFVLFTLCDLWWPPNPQRPKWHAPFTVTSSPDAAADIAPRSGPNGTRALGSPPKSDQTRPRSAPLSFQPVHTQLSPNHTLSPFHPHPLHQQVYHHPHSERCAAPSSPSALRSSPSAAPAPRPSGARDRASRAPSTSARAPIILRPSGLMAVRTEQNSGPRDNRSPSIEAI